MPDTAAVLAEQLEASSGIPASHLEKDLWVTESLRIMARTASKEPYELVFKGGTSLSKAHGLIHRFSEDIDVLLVFTGQGTASRESAMKRLLGAVEQALDVELDHDPPGAKGKRKGSHRSAAFGWVRSGQELLGVRPGVLLELGARGGSMPKTTEALRPLMAHYAQAAGIEFPYAEHEAFGIAVMEPQRTLIEKLMLIHTAASMSDAPEHVKRIAARHYYDVYCLLTSEEVRSSLTDGAVVHLARDIHTHSIAAGRPSSERPPEGFAVSPAVDRRRVVEAADEYETVVLDGLIWPTAPVIPTFDDCLGAIRASAALL